jgi:hypothetical protein
VDTSGTIPEREPRGLAEALRGQLRYGLDPGHLADAPELLSFAPREAEHDNPVVQASALYRALLASIDRLSPESSRAVMVLFGLVPETRHMKLMRRRELAADVLDVTPVTFRRRREPQLLEHVARELQLQTAIRWDGDDRRRVPINVFISTPSGESWADVRDTIKGACRDAADSFPSLSWSSGADLTIPGGTAASIMNAIEVADLFIADATDSRPNVMFELGFAVANGKQLVILNQQANHMPFDLAGWRQLVYARDDLATFREQLANQLLGAIQMAIRRAVRLAPSRA